MGAVISTNWDLSGRDVVPELGVGGAARDVGAAILYAMLQSEGTAWKAPYDNVRAKLKIRNKQVAPELQEQADQRFRTYKTLFRGLGLLYDEAGVLHATDAGSEVLELLSEQYQAVDDYGRQLTVASRPRLARLVAPVLARYQLASPTSTTEYPAGTDIRPLLAIWQAMRGLDNKLHWEEMGRVLTSCLRDADVPAAIQTIRDARARQDYKPSDPARMEAILGPRRPDAGSNQSDRLDTWFSRAAFKGLLLEPRDRSDGYRYLSVEFSPLLDEMIANPPNYNDTTDAGDYIRWLGAGRAAEQVASSDFDSMITRIVGKCRRYGSRQIIALVGPAGTGKTRAAQEVAMILADGDESRVVTVQFHAGFTYEEFIGGLAPSESGFQPALGALLEINKNAHEEPGQTHVLVIDELSRADVANVLGELLTYIEYRDRLFRIPVFDQPFSIAPNLVVLATMNPADRSVVNMDDAMIRRLRQVQVSSDPHALQVILAEAGMRETLANEVVSWFKALPRDVPFGHGVFVGVRDEADLHDLWHEALQFFLRRGGISVYPDPSRIEKGFVWRSEAFQATIESPNETETVA